MRIGNRLADIEKELSEEGIKPKATKALTAEKESLFAERETLEVEKDNGWVLLDFPSSYA